MVYYKLILIITNAEQLAKISIEIVIKYQGLLNAIVTNRGSLFTSKFSFFSLPLFQRQASTPLVFYPKTDGQTERQNSNIEVYPYVYCQLD